MANSELPLHCSICPKKPDFSDISHLLTHIASKGHLSHYYKIKVRSGHDKAARESVESYDNWYVEWNVERLMSERMHLKDRKKRTRARDQVPPPIPTPKTQKIIAPVFDPHLSLEIQDAINSNKSGASLTLPYPLLPQQCSKPRLHRWDTSKPASYRAVLVDYSSPPLLPQFDDIALFHSDAFILETVEDDEEDDFELTEATKLKGILWPGMDIFDAATPLMRKKRNQKKHGSVVARLESNSLLVEPTEIIYSPMGTLKKERKITGRVDLDSSPILMYEEILPQPSKRRAQTKGPLGEKDINAPKVKRVQAKASQAKTTKKRQVVDDEGIAVPKTKKRAFPVFRDADEEEPFGNPSGMMMLTAEYQPAPSPNAARPQVSPMKTGSQYPPPYYAEGYEGYQAVTTAPQYEMYGGYDYDIPGFFTYPPQQRQHIPGELLALQDTHQSDD